MIFEFYDPESAWFYTINFGWCATPGFLLELKANIVRFDGTIGPVLIHRTFVNIKNGIIEWEEYHTREDDPLTSKSFRSFAQKLVNNKAFM